MNWYLAVLKKYVVVEGRARRKEYWIFVLINLVVSLILAVIDSATGSYDPESGLGLLGTLYALGVFLPSVTVAVRRLHDTDRSGWWLLLVFLPIIGFLVLLVFMVLPGTPGDNRFGVDPLTLPDPA
ncbi:MAG: DUF805 domain-containing protein [Pseudomonadota bacterium]